MDLASENSETDDNLAETDTTALLLEIRRDVKKMNKKFDHLEKSVRTLKHDSKPLKEQNIRKPSYRLANNGIAARISYSRYGNEK